MVNLHTFPSNRVKTQERTREADRPSSPVMTFGADQPLKLDCGISLSPFQIAYQT
jgi:homoserine O-acetyltransferase